ncbi:MAG: hypothetical protein AAFP90_04915 [Planctomycetota bacterium]
MLNRSLLCSVNRGQCRREGEQGLCQRWRAVYVLVRFVIWFGEMVTGGFVAVLPLATPRRRGG